MIRRDGAVGRGLASHQCAIGEFVVGSHLNCSEGFSPGTPVSLTPEKPTLFSKFQFELAFSLNIIVEKCLVHQFAFLHSFNSTELETQS